MICQAAQQERNHRADIRGLGKPVQSNAFQQSRFAILLQRLFRHIGFHPAGSDDETFDVVLSKITRDGFTQRDNASFGSCITQIIFRITAKRRARCDINDPPSPVLAKMQDSLFAEDGNCTKIDRKHFIAFLNPLLILKRRQRTNTRIVHQGIYMPEPLNDFRKKTLTGNRIPKISLKSRRIVARLLHDATGSILVP